MASEHQVRQYLAYWFQVGKPLRLGNGSETFLPRPVRVGDRYSPEFETGWQRLREVGSEQCYLDGTEQTIADLLSPTWDIHPCARCAMLVPIRSFGIQPMACPCSDICNWPNTEIPLPHAPENVQKSLTRIRDRLRELQQKIEESAVSDRVQGSLAIVKSTHFGVAAVEVVEAVVNDRRGMS